MWKFVKWAWSLKTAEEMKRMDELKKGQEVVIKSAKSLSGTVVSSRDDGDEGVFYKVLVPERTMYFRRADLEPWPPDCETAAW
jgi:hypothetical protein